MGPAEKVLFVHFLLTSLKNRVLGGKRRVDAEGTGKSGYFSNSGVTLTHWAQGLKSISFMTMCSKGPATASLKDHSQEKEPYYHFAMATLPIKDFMTCSPCRGICIHG